MVTQALYRRWRSQTFSQIIGQDHVTHTLLNALRAGRIAHAYLFSGPRGTGKTTTARVLAKAVNCLDPQNGEPCNRCVICRSLNEGRSLDLIEIDAASNRGIDEIRDLRDKIAFSPSECRYKVYVVDEVHMLTNEAFNALLKTLEEPPPHAIFVLATTEPHKIPATVLSRCQRFDFRRVSLPNLKKKLELICSQEEIHIEPSALDAIARHAAGSFRDAESLLDQLVSYGLQEIALEDVRRVLGSAPEQIVSGIVQASATGDASTGLSLVTEALDSGVEPRQLTREVLEYLRGLLLVKNGGASLCSESPETLREMAALAQGIPLLHLLRIVRLFNEAANNLKTGTHLQLPLELAVVEASLMVNQPSPSGGEPRNGFQPQPVVEERPVPSDARKTVAAAGESSAVNKASGPGQRAEHPTSELTDDGDSVEMLAPEVAVRSSEEISSGQGAEITLTWLQDNWGELLQAIRPHDRMVEALLKSCEPVSIQDGVVMLGFYHSFHRDKVNEDHHRATVEERLRELSGQPLRVRCSLIGGDRAQKEQQREASHREELIKNPVVQDAINNLGARVVDTH
jgi:DNA polymerase-3 subunit gamma/tau